MITGHAGLAFAAKGVAPEVPLWLFLVAAYAPDVAQVSLDLLSTSGPSAALWSHSIPAAALLAGTLAAMIWRVAGDRRAAALAAALVALHVSADYVTGLKPTWAGGPSIGLGLYEHPARDFVLEAIVVAFGWLLHARTRARRGHRLASAVPALVVLVVVQAAADAQIRLGGRLIP